MPQKNRPTHRIQIRHEDLLEVLLKGQWVAWWYGVVKRNLRAGTLPTVVIWFRELLPDGNFGDEFKRASVGINMLALIQLGTIWSDGECGSLWAYEEQKTFDVDFSDGGWHLTSQAESNLLPRDEYLLKYSNADRSKILVFALKDGRQLLVPSLEFFSRCYGSSGHVRRVLSTYFWHEAKPRLCERIYADVPPGC